MAYQNVGTPRFYINYYLWGHALGITELDSRIDGNPTNISTNFGSMGYRIPAIGEASRPNFIAYLGHNFASQNIGARHYYKPNPDLAGADTWDGGHQLGDIVNGTNGSFTPYNGNSGGDYLMPEYDGFSICSVDNGTDDYPYYESRIQIYGASSGASLKLGTVILGRTYEMPHSPDLNLKMSIKMDGVKNIKTKGGASLTGINYTKPQNWGSMGAWQLGGVSNLRSGRRVWDLSFNYLSDSGIMPVVAATTNLGAGDNEDTSNPNENTLLDGTDFFSSVWNKTMGGHLPFIFQPDKDNNNPDQFAICRFDMKSLVLTQKMHRKYNVKLKIRECW